MSSIGEVIARLAPYNLKPRTMMSVGAGAGADTPWYMRRLGLERALLIEAQAAHLPALDGLKGSDARIDYLLCVAHERDGECRFAATAPTGGAISVGGTLHRTRSIDSIARERKLLGPFFLKLDTHGAEVSVLRGAAATLAETELVLMEVYNFKLGFTGRSNLTFDEMSLYMKSHGFYPAAIADPLARPRDGILWQMQMFFVRTDNAAFDEFGFK